MYFNSRFLIKLGDAPWFWTIKNQIICLLIQSLYKIFFLLLISLQKLKDFFPGIFDVPVSGNLNHLLYGMFDLGFYWIFLPDQRNICRVLVFLVRLITIFNEKFMFSWILFFILSLPLNSSILTYTLHFFNTFQKE